MKVIRRSIVFDIACEGNAKVGLCSLPLTLYDLCLYNQCFNVCLAHTITSVMTSKTIYLLRLPEAYHFIVFYAYSPLRVCSSHDLFDHVLFFNLLVPTEPQEINKKHIKASCFLSTVLVDLFLSYSGLIWNLNHQRFSAYHSYIKHKRHTIHEVLCSFLLAA